jgi:hypothetical protein
MPCPKDCIASGLLEYLRTIAIVQRDKFPIFANPLIALSKTKCPAYSNPKKHCRFSFLSFLGNENTRKNNPKKIAIPFTFCITIFKPNAIIDM